MFNVNSDCTEEKNKTTNIRNKFKFQNGKNVIMTRLTIKVEKLKIK